MNFIDSVRDATRSLTRDPAGQRFQNLFAKINHLGLSMKIAGFFIGILLILGGILLGLVPGIPGVVLFFLGLGLIAGLFKTTAVFCDHLEIYLRKLFSWIRGFFIIPAPRHIKHPVMTPQQLQVNGVVMKVVDDGQHTGLESRFEEEMSKVLKKKST